MSERESAHDRRRRELTHRMLGRLAAVGFGVAGMIGATIVVVVMSRSGGYLLPPAAFAALFAGTSAASGWVGHVLTVRLLLSGRPDRRVLLYLVVFGIGQMVVFWLLETELSLRVWNAGLVALVAHAILAAWDVVRLRWWPGVLLDQVGLLLFSLTGLALVAFTSRFPGTSLFALLPVTLPLTLALDGRPDDARRWAITSAGQPSTLEAIVLTDTDRLDDLAEVLDALPEEVPLHRYCRARLLELEGDLPGALQIIDALWDELPKPYVATDRLRLGVLTDTPTDRTVWATRASEPASSPWVARLAGHRPDLPGILARAWLATADGDDQQLDDLLSEAGALAVGRTVQAGLASSRARMLHHRGRAEWTEAAEPARAYGGAPALMVSRLTAA